MGDQSKVELGWFCGVDSKFAVTCVPLTTKWAFTTVFWTKLMSFNFLLKDDKNFKQ